MSRIYSPSGLVVGSTRDYVEVRRLRAAFPVCVKVVSDNTKNLTEPTQNRLQSRERRGMLIQGSENQVT